MNPLILLLFAVALAVVDNLARRRLSVAEVAAAVLGFYALTILL